MISFSPNLYNEILKSTEMTNTFDRDSLISDYAEQVIDGMDLNTLARFAFDMMCENMEKMYDEDIVKEVNEFFPELLEEYNIDPDMYV